VAADHNAEQRCDTCGARLANMAKLIEHVARYHPTREDS
jgi:hypothetical protein